MSFCSLLLSSSNLNSSFKAGNSDFSKLRTLFHILDIFDDIAKDPYTSDYDIKPYKCSYNNTYRLRVGKYRYIYRIFDEEILILVSGADSRGSIYK